MAQSTCPKCGGHSFELMENSPAKAAWSPHTQLCREASRKA